jgi:hypothetical protein
MQEEIHMLLLLESEGAMQEGIKASNGNQG